MKSSRFRRLFVTMLAVMAAGGCVKDDIGTAQVGTDAALKLRIAGSIDEVAATRVDDSGFVDGDRIGVYAVDWEGNSAGVLAAENNRASNVCFTYDYESNVWNGNSDIYFRDDETPIDIYGYYPFVNYVPDIATYGFEVAANQNSDGADGLMSGYEASDFLWAKTSGVYAADGKAVLNFSHRMAGIKVILKAGEGISATEWEKSAKQVGVANVRRGASINLADGTVTAKGDTGADVAMAAQGDDTWRAVVPPQSVGAGAVIRVTFDGDTYALTKDAAVAYEASKLYQFTITVSRRSDTGALELALLSESILPWENDSKSHNFTANSYIIVDCPERGQLEDCIKAAGINPATLKNLKVNGELGDLDFKWMRESLPMLQAINLVNTRLIGWLGYWTNGYTQWIWVEDGVAVPEGTSVENMLPNTAFSHMENLRTVVLPTNLVRIGGSAFQNTSLRGYLSIPDTVTRIDGSAFAYTSDEYSMRIPANVEYIGGGAYAGCQAEIEFNIPNSCTYIGEIAFNGAKNVYGTFSLPASLTYLGTSAFASMGHDMDGDIEIPVGVTEFAGAFNQVGFKNGTNVYLHAGIKNIMDSSFARLKILNTVVIPEGCSIISRNAFAESNMVGGVKLHDNIVSIGLRGFFLDNVGSELTLPASLMTVSQEAFAGASMKSLVIPDNVEMIGLRAFSECSKLLFVQIGRNVGYISENAFDCSQLTTVVCLAKTPPSAATAFVNLPWDKAILEVPEESVELYRRAEGWSQFRSITPHREMSVNITRIDALNAPMTREARVNAEGAWSVAECPSWCHVSPSSSDSRKEEITITVDALARGAGDREGRIVFNLTGKNYQTDVIVSQLDYEYAEGEEIVLQRASAGAPREIPIFIVGEGFTAPDIRSGRYLELMKQQMEYLFDIEPYRTYRNYFTVSTAVAVSPEEGEQTVVNIVENKFNTIDGDCNHDELRKFVVSSAAGIDDSNFRDALVILLVNTERFGGNAPINWERLSLAVCPISTDSYPYDQRGVIQHFAGGIAFGKLGDENITHYDFLTRCSCPYCNKLALFNEAKSYGWFKNLSLSSKMNDVPWRHLIFDPRYSAEVDVYEGGYHHSRGVFRSEAQSCMSTYVPYYNAISRQAIVERIMELSGRTFDFEEFAANDKRDNF